MPKQKTHKGTAKRVRVTGTGKLVREHTNNQHKFEVKSSSRKRRVSGTGELSPADAPRKRRLDQDQVVSKADTKGLKKLLGI